LVYEAFSEESRGCWGGKTGGKMSGLAGESWKREDMTQVVGGASSREKSISKRGKGERKKM